MAKERSFELHFYLNKTLLYTTAATLALFGLHRYWEKEEGFKSANITSLRFSFQGFVVLARRDMDKSTSLRGELVWFGLHNVILPSNPTHLGLYFLTYFMILKNSDYLYVRNMNKTQFKVPHCGITTAPPTSFETQRLV